jgi:hypothetical protein
MVQINAYAEDVVIISRNSKALEEALQVTAQEIGFIINQEKPKYMRLSTKMHGHCRQTAVGGYSFERVFSFPYLGSVINYDNSISEEITQN